MNNKLILYSLSGHLTPSNITWKLTTLPRHKIHHLVTAHTSHLIFWTLVHYQILHYNVGEMDKIHHTNQSVTDITDWHSICHLAFFSSSSEWLEKASRTSSHLLAGYDEERPIIPQPQCGRCHRAGTGQATLEFIGNQQSYALKWCKPNNDDDWWLMNDDACIYQLQTSVWLSDETQSLW